MDPLDSEDKRKLHAEVNQLVNQRFVVTTTAISISGLVAGWMVTRNGPSQTMFSSVAMTVASTVMVVVLFFLAVLNYKASQMLRVLTCYLLAREASMWERDWKAYRDRPLDYPGYTKPYAVMFGVLFALGGILPLISAICNGQFKAADWTTWHPAMPTLLALVFAVSVFGLNRRAEHSDERYLANWKAILQSRDTK